MKKPCNNFILLSLVFIVGCHDPYVTKTEYVYYDNGNIKGSIQYLRDVKHGKVVKYYEDGSPAISGIKRVSKPGLKIYVKKNDIPSYFSGMGVAIMSTSKGIMTGFKAKKQSLGGEVLFYIW